MEPQSFCRYDKHLDYFRLTKKKTLVLLGLDSSA